MARVTHVKKAQQRFETVPVLDEDGKPKRTPVMQNGKQKVSKRGPVFMAVTVADPTRPLPPYTCDYCHEAIKVGDPYKHVTPKSGPYGGRKRTRHEKCPTWHSWDLSNSLGARIEQVQYEFGQAISGVESEDDTRSALESAADSIEEIADEKDESAQNIEDGFQHETEQSQELRDIAENLRNWAEEVRSADVPEFPEPEEQECEECEGLGLVASSETGDKECEACEGMGKVTPDEPTDDQISDWQAEVEDTLTSVVDESPV
jgi:hypothetical protein